MGIRFDRDAKRATNGPLIFFSDAMSETAFSEEIRGAILSGLSFYSYRLPGDLMISFGSSEGYVEGIEMPGFVIGKFHPRLPYLTIPYRGSSRNEVNQGKYEIPVTSTEFTEYAMEVDEIISSLKQSGHRGKVVAARVIVKEETLDPAALFFTLLKKFPEAFVFCFSTPATGCWIGASPELLLESDEGILNTMSLAGTREAFTEGDWDMKNVEEQAMVTDYIADVFQRNSLKPEIGKNFTKRSGNIEHICTPISTQIAPGENFNIEKLLRDLSPTPALCGEPREFALDIIEKYEGFDRGCYGGFCGPFHSLSDFRLNVVVRCASFNERRFCVYAGGGITLKSDIQKEWEETGEKAKALLDQEIGKV